MDSSNTAHDALWLGVGFVRTAGPLGTSFWARRFLQLTVHSLEWYFDELRTSVAGSVALAGASLVLAKEALIDAGGSRQLCLDLDWVGKEYLPIRFALADGHDVALGFTASAAAVAQDVLRLANVNVDEVVALREHLYGADEDVHDHDGTPVFSLAHDEMDYVTRRDADAYRSASDGFTGGDLSSALVHEGSAESATDAFAPSQSSEAAVKATTRSVASVQSQRAAALTYALHREESPVARDRIFDRFTSTLRANVEPHGPTILGTAYRAASSSDAAAAKASLAAAASSSLPHARVHTVARKDDGGVGSDVGTSEKLQDLSDVIFDGTIFASASAADSGVPAPQDLAHVSVSRGYLSCSWKGDVKLIFHLLGARASVSGEGGAVLDAASAAVRDGLPAVGDVGAPPLSASSAVAPDDVSLPWGRDPSPTAALSPVIWLLVRAMHPPPPRSSRKQGNGARGVSPAGAGEMPKHASQHSRGHSSAHPHAQAGETSVWAPRVALVSRDGCLWMWPATGADADASPLPSEEFDLRSSTATPVALLPGLPHGSGAFSLTLSPAAALRAGLPDEDRCTVMLAVPNAGRTGVDSWIAACASSAASAAGTPSPMSAADRLRNGFPLPARPGLPDRAPPTTADVLGKVYGSIMGVDALLQGSLSPSVSPAAKKTASVEPTVVTPTSPRTALQPVSLPLLPTPWSSTYDVACSLRTELRGLSSALSALDSGAIVSLAAAAVRGNDTLVNAIAAVNETANALANVDTLASSLAANAGIDSRAQESAVSRIAQVLAAALPLPLPSALAAHVECIRAAAQIAFGDTALPTLRAARTVHMNKTLSAALDSPATRVAAPDRLAMSAAALLVPASEPVVEVPDVPAAVSAAHVEKQQLPLAAAPSPVNSSVITATPSLTSLLSRTVDDPTTSAHLDALLAYHSPLQTWQAWVSTTGGSSRDALSADWSAFGARIWAVLADAHGVDRVAPFAEPLGIPRALLSAAAWDEAVVLCAAAQPPSPTRPLWARAGPRRARGVTDADISSLLAQVDAIDKSDGGLGSLVPTRANAPTKSIMWPPPPPASVAVVSVSSPKTVPSSPTDAATDANVSPSTIPASPPSLARTGQNSPQFSTSPTSPGISSAAATRAGTFLRKARSPYLPTTVLAPSSSSAPTVSRPGWNSSVLTHWKGLVAPREKMSRLVEGRAELHSDISKVITPLVAAAPRGGGGWLRSAGSHSRAHKATLPSPSVAAVQKTRTPMASAKSSAAAPLESTEVSAPAPDPVSLSAPAPVPVPVTAPVLQASAPVSPPPPPPPPPVITPVSVLVAPSVSTVAVTTAAPSAAPAPAAPVVPDSTPALPAWKIALLKNKKGAEKAEGASSPTALSSAAKTPSASAATSPVASPLPPSSPTSAPAHVSTPKSTALSGREVAGGGLSLSRTAETHASPSHSKAAVVHAHSGHGGDVSHAVANLATPHPTFSGLVTHEAQEEHAAPPQEYAHAHHHDGVPFSGGGTASTPSSLSPPRAHPATPSRSTSAASGASSNIPRPSTPARAAMGTPTRVAGSGATPLRRANDSLLPVLSPRRDGVSSQRAAVPTVAPTPPPPHAAPTAPSDNNYAHAWEQPVAPFEAALRPHSGHGGAPTRAFDAAAPHAGHAFEGLQVHAPALFSVPQQLQTVGSPSVKRDLKGAVDRLRSERTATAQDHLERTSVRARVLAGSSKPLAAPSVATVKSPRFAALSNALAAAVEEGENVASRDGGVLD